MRSVPHPVAIITSTSTYTTPTTSSNSTSSNNASLDLFRGATVSSFNTVTLTPTPIVSFNITRHSSTFHAIQLSGMFNVHLLTSDVQMQPEPQQQHDGSDASVRNRDRDRDHPELIATKFSKGNKGRPFHQDTGELEPWIDLSSASTGRASRESARLPPVIRGQTDEGIALVPFHLLCEHMTEKTVWIGDHVVVFGQVVNVVDNLRKKKSNGSGLEYQNPKPTLAYVHGKYARVV
ncbi:hypothetical protein DV735_g2498, partial [Chaetothyriales sp. CBS 134920]